MPFFTIETTYRLPVYRHRTYEAETVEQACRLAIEDDDWDEQKHDYETAGESYVSGAWRGDTAYSGRAEHFPSRFEETNQRKVDHFETLLGLLKIFAQARPLDKAAREFCARILGATVAGRRRKGGGHPRRRQQSRRTDLRGVGILRRRPHHQSSRRDGLPLCLGCEVGNERILASAGDAFSDTHGS